MTAQTTDVLLLEDLDDSGRTGALAPGDLTALRAVADWMRTFIVRPHQDLGRAGPVCPFVPRSLEQRTLWLAPERIADRDVPAVVELMDRYRRRLLAVEPADGDAAGHPVFVVVFPDLSADRARTLFADVLEQLAVPSYVEDGIVFGPFYEGHAGTAIYNGNFRPFQSPVPFIFVRRAVVGDWKFYLDDAEWLGHWAHRFGESGAHALADELRRLPWRTRRD
jgi:hypothetical protein